MQRVIEDVFFCSKCGRSMRPAPARFDGEPTYVGFFPCPCNRPIMTDFGVVYPGDDEHKRLMASGSYSINDLLTPIDGTSEYAVQNSPADALT